MKESHVNDWKDVANTYFDKCIALIILFLMFFFIVYPKVETKILRTIEREIDAIEIQEEILENIEKPPDIVRPIQEIELVDPDDVAEDEEITVIVSIGSTTNPTDILPPPPKATSKFFVPEEPPVLVYRVNPEYPAMHRRMRTEGIVVLEAEVLADGTIGLIEVKTSLGEGPGNFDEAAINAVKQWRYQPALTNGLPVACWISQPIRFTLNN